LASMQAKILISKQHTCCIFIFICVLFCTYTKFQTIINNRAVSFCTQGWRGTMKHFSWVKFSVKNNFFCRLPRGRVDIVFKYSSLFFINSLKEGNF
jgi:hypothetical protein